MNLQRAAALTILLSTCVAQPAFNCNPCINRANHVVKAILQGTKTDPFWQQVEAAMRQSERDMRVSLDMELYDTLDTEQMAADIRATVRAADRPEALIVTIPSDDVKDAVSEAIEAGLPVFGLHDGYGLHKELGMQGFVAMDQKEAGVAAGKKFLEMKEATTNVAYVTSAIRDNEGFDAERLEGLRSVIDDVRVIEGGFTSEDFAAGCPFDAVLLASADLSQEVVESYEENGCDLVSYPVATFDHSASAHRLLSSGYLAFAVSQEQYLQGAFSVVAAALFATNGRVLASSSESIFGVQTVGPKIVTRDSPVSDSVHRCQDEAFPVCSDSLAQDILLHGTIEPACDCTERKKIKIAGVLHAVTTDEFWDVVYESTNHAADDFGIELELDRMEPNIDPDELLRKMARKIESLCQQGVDGIFVTIPSEAVFDGIESCLERNVPVISINAGPEYSKDLELYHHIGMVDKNAGKEAGKRIVEAAKGQMKKALCLIHAPNNVALINRCKGFREGVLAAATTAELRDIEIRDVYVPEDNDSRYHQIVDNHIKNMTADGDDWGEGVGILLGGHSQIAPGLLLKKSHPKVLLGAFDTNDQLYEALESGDILFGIDQSPYLQGYLPVALLTWHAYTGQLLSNHLVETGPTFVTRAPSAEESFCQASHFHVCARPRESVAALPQLRSQPETMVEQKQGAIIIGLSVIIAALAVSFGFVLHRIRHLNEQRRKTGNSDSGQEVPKGMVGARRISASVN